MRRLLPFFCLIMVGSLASAARSSADDLEFTTFEHLAAGIPRVATRATLARAGFAFDSAGKHNNELFIGSVDGTRTDLWAYYDGSDRVAKIVLNIETDDAAAHSTYDRVRSVLVQEFGDPTNSFAFLKKPFTPDQETAAIRSGKGFFSSYWTRYDGGELAEEITSMLTVQISFEGSNWVPYLRSQESLIATPPGP